MIESVLNRLSAIGSIRQLDMGNLATVKKSLMHYSFGAYDANVVRFSTIRMKAFFGLMKMESLVISPLTKDAPLMSADFISAFGKETLLVEFYDLTLRPSGELPSLQAITDSCKDLPDTKVSERWYDSLKLRPTIAKKGKNLTERFNALCEQYVQAYIEYLKTAPDCDKSQKQACLRDYVEGMFANGSPTVEVFSKLLDRRTARELYGKYLFFSED